MPDPFTGIASDVWGPTGGGGYEEPSIPPTDGKKKYPTMVISRIDGKTKEVRNDASTDPGSAISTLNNATISPNVDWWGPRSSTARLSGGTGASVLFAAKIESIAGKESENTGSGQVAEIRLARKTGADGQYLVTEKDITRDFLKVTKSSSTTKGPNEKWTVSEVKRVSLTIKAKKSTSTDDDTAPVDDATLDPARTQEELGKSGKTKIEPDVTRETMVSLLPVEIVTDIDNDGEIGDADSGLAKKAFDQGATEEDIEKGTEYLFVNDDLSNGLWDKDDPDSAGGNNDDDDAQEISITEPGLDEGEVWLDHPAIDALTFYDSRECTTEVPLKPGNRFPLGQQDWPDSIFVRADGNSSAISDQNPQAEGDLVLKLKIGNEEVEGPKIKLSIVKALGAAKYFQAVRDTIYEDNLRRFVDEIEYGGTTFRLVLMCEEHASMWPEETFHRDPQLEGIHEVAAAYPNATVILNGNVCRHSGSDQSESDRGNPMTDECLGRIVKNHTLDTAASVTGTTGLAGPDGRYVAFHSGNLSGGDLETPRFEFGSGHVPVGNNIAKAAMGGLAGNYAASDRNTFLTIVGYAPANSDAEGFEAHNGVIFTATTVKGKGNAPDLAADAGESGVRTLSGAPTGYRELLMLDGAASVALSHLDPDGNMNVEVAKLRHGAFGSRGIPEFINTYLIFHTYPPRTGD